MSYNTVIYTYCNALSISLAYLQICAHCLCLGELDVEYDEERYNPDDEYDPTKVYPGTEHLWRNEHGEKIYYDGSESEGYDEDDDDDYDDDGTVELEKFYIDDADDIDMSLRI